MIGMALGVASIALPMAGRILPGLGRFAWAARAAGWLSRVPLIGRLFASGASVRTVSNVAGGASALGAVGIGASGVAAALFWIAMVGFAGLVALTGYGLCKLVASRHSREIAEENPTLVQEQQALAQVMTPPTAALSVTTSLPLNERAVPTMMTGAPSTAIHNALPQGYYVVPGGQGQAVNWAMRVERPALLQTSYAAAEQARRVQGAIRERGIS